MRKCFEGGARNRLLRAVADPGFEKEGFQIAIRKLGGSGGMPPKNFYFNSGVF